MKKVVLYLTFILLLSSFAHAGIQYNNTYNPTAYIWNLNETVGTIAYNSNGSASPVRHNGTLTNGPTYTNGLVAGTSLYFDGTNQYITVPSALGSPYTYCAWINTTVQTQGIMQIPGGANVKMYLVNGKVWCRSDSGAVKVLDQQNGNVSDGETHHVCCMDQGAGTKNMTIYIDGKQNRTTLFGSAGGVSGASHNWGYNGSSYYTGQLDDILFFTRIMPEHEIFTIYRNGTQYTGGPVANITLVNQTPGNGFNWNNGSLDFDSYWNFTNPSTCNLTLNAKVNQTVGPFIGDNQLVNYSVYLEDGTWVWNVTCTDTETTVISPGYTLYVDRINPTYTTNFTNNQAIFPNGKLRGTWNLSDNDLLHSINVTINGETLFSNESINQQKYTYNIEYSPVNYSGVNTLVVQFSDGHTAKEIPDYIVGQPILNDWLQYEFYDNPGYVKVKGLPSSIFDKFTTAKEIDRYTIGYEPWDKSKDMYDFEVESSYDIDIVDAPWTKYGKWLIMGDKWLDFDTAQGDYESIELERISDKKVRVILGGVQLSDGKLEFHSIGDLNTVTLNYSFFVMNITEYFPVGNISEGSSNVFALNFTYNSTYITDIDANLTFNGTSYVTSKYVEPTYIYFTQTLTAPIVDLATLYYFNWNYSIKGVAGDYSNYTLTRNVTVTNFLLSNCSGSTNYGLNFSIFDEDVQTPLNASVEFTIYTDVSNLTYNYSNVNKFQVCIDPPNANLSIDAYVKYTPTESFTHRYYINNGTISNLTQLVNLYNFPNTSNKETLKIVVKDEEFNYYPDIFVVMQRLYLSENQYKQVQMDKTGDFGDILFHIIEQSQDYKFIFYNEDNEILYTSQTMKILCGTDCQLTFQLPSAAGSVQSLDGFYWNYSYTNSTGLVTLSWMDTTGATDEIRFDVIKKTMARDIVICRQSIYTVSGSANCNISDYEGSIFVKAYRTASPERPFLFEEITKAAAQLSSLLSREDSAIFGVFIMIPIVLSGFWNPVALIGSAVFGLFVLASTGLFTWITFSLIMVAALIGGIIAIIIRR